MAFNLQVAGSFINCSVAHAWAVGILAASQLPCLSKHAGAGDPEIDEEPGQVRTEVDPCTCECPFIKSQ